MPVRLPPAHARHRWPAALVAALRVAHTPPSMSTAGDGLAACSVHECVRPPLSPGEVRGRSYLSAPWSELGLGRRRRGRSRHLQPHSKWPALSRDISAAACAAAAFCYMRYAYAPSAQGGMGHSQSVLSVVVARSFVARSSRIAIAASGSTCSRPPAASFVRGARRRAAQEPPGAERGTPEGTEGRRRKFYICHSTSKKSTLHVVKAFYIIWPYAVAGRKIPFECPLLEKEENREISPEVLLFASYSCFTTFTRV